MKMIDADAMRSMHAALATSKDVSGRSAALAPASTPFALASVDEVRAG